MERCIDGDRESWRQRDKDRERWRESEMGKVVDEGDEAVFFRLFRNVSMRGLHSECCLSEARVKDNAKSSGGTQEPSLSAHGDRPVC